MKRRTRHLIRSANSGNMAIAHHAPQEQKVSGTQIVPVNSQYPQHKCNSCKKGYVPIVYASQESISVQNALVITLHALKTIFQHLAEFSLSKDEKMGSQ